MTSPCLVCCRCFITPHHYRAGGSGPYAHQIGPALIKVTDLFKYQFLQQPPHCGSVNYTRATGLAWNLNQEAALLTKLCQQSPVAAPFVHLEQDQHYNVLRSVLMPRSHCKMSANPHAVLTADAGSDSCFCSDQEAVQPCVHMCTIPTVMHVMQLHGAVSKPAMSDVLPF